MAVYVDPLIHYWKGRLWCHLTADTTEELHEFAAKIGLKRSWFQSGSILPHYDITGPVRQKALALGAKELSTIEAGKRIHDARLLQMNGGV